MTKTGLDWLMLRNDTVNPLPTLAQLLEALPRSVEHLGWRLSGVWCLGDNAETFHRWSDGSANVPGGELSKAAGTITQVIDGRFDGEATTNPTCMVSIRAANSCAR